MREADGKNIVWWEPQQFAGGQKLETYFTSVAGEKNLGFSWHNYCPDVFFESQGIPGGDTENCRDVHRRPREPRHRPGRPDERRRR